MDRYVFWVYPHALTQKGGSDEVYYTDLYGDPTNISPTLIPRIHKYEWNFIVIEFQRHVISGREIGTVNVYVNLKIAESDYSYNITNSALLDNYNAQAIAFCNGDYTCTPLGSQLNLIWTAAYYSIKSYLDCCILC